MHYISYKWANNQLWTEEFDFVFRVRLKDLNTDWEKNYRTELENCSQADLFACFLHNSLRIGKQRLDDIKKFQTFLQPHKSKILLLIDGYDEIQYLLLINHAQKESAIFIINEIKTYQNFIMTSRPNSVPDHFFEENKGKFDSIIENLGLDDNGIRQYIQNYFEIKKNKSFEISLIQFL